MIYIESRRKKITSLQKKYPGACICDVTSSGNNSLVLFSPFYPHGNIPIPFSSGSFSYSVEGVWQGLKVFEKEDVCLSSFSNSSMKNIKRFIGKRGELIGHRKGIEGTEILSYLEARKQIYLPTYKWVLENIEPVKDLVNRMRLYNEKHDIVLLDYNTNSDVNNLSSPLSHASLIKLYIEGKYPY